jgi:hypothetical protein
MGWTGALYGPNLAYCKSAASETAQSGTIRQSDRGRSQASRDPRRRVGRVGRMPEDRRLLVQVFSFEGVANAVTGHEDVGVLGEGSDSMFESIEPRGASVDLHRHPFWYVRGVRPRRERGEQRPNERRARGLRAPRIRASLKRPRRNAFRGVDRFPNRVPRRRLFRQGHHHPATGVGPVHALRVHGQAPGGDGVVAARCLARCGGQGDRRGAAADRRTVDRCTRRSRSL